MGYVAWFVYVMTIGMSQTTRLVEVHETKERISLFMYAFLES